jgi:hypothetical protein
MREFNWKDSLLQLFAATVNQQTLEEAAELMVSVGAKDRSYHEECLRVFDHALQAIEDEGDFVISCINKSGYQVDSISGAKDLLSEFRSIYDLEYRLAISKIS